MSESSPRKFSAELNVRSLPRLQAGRTVVGLSCEAGASPLIYEWREAYARIARLGSITSGVESYGGKRRCPSPSCPAFIGRRCDH